jgi:hypothetical protein
MKARGLDTIVVCQNDFQIAWVLTGQDVKRDRNLPNS